MRRLVAVAVAVLAVTLGAAAPATAGTPLNYVALGDSAAAGPIILPQVFPQPTPCFRSTKNFPHVLAAALGATLTDVTCSSAKVPNLWQSQSDAPPQLDALTPQTDLVTLGPIGANDIDVGSLVVDCLVPGCAQREAGSRDAALATLATNLDRALTEIHTRSPHAQVVVISYGKQLPDGGCFPYQPIQPAEAAFVGQIGARLLGTLRDAAAAHGARFVDLAAIPGADDHTTCATPGQNWIEGTVPVVLDGSISFHPTTLGMSVWGTYLAGVV